MKTLSSYIANAAAIDESAGIPALPSDNGQLLAICAKNPLWKSLEKKCSQAGYILQEAYNEMYGGKLAFTHLAISQTRHSQPRLSGTFTLGKSAMMVDVAGRGFLGGAELQNYIKELQTAASLAAWIDRLDLTKLPCFEMESVDEAEENKVPVKFELAYKMFDKKGQIVSKRKSFKTSKARAKFVEKIKQDGNFYDIIAYLDE